MECSYETSKTTFHLLQLFLFSVDTDCESPTWKDQDFSAVSVASFQKGKPDEQMGKEHREEEVSSLE